MPSVSPSPPEGKWTFVTSHLIVLLCLAEDPMIRMADALLAAPVAESPYVVMAKDSFPEFRSAMEVLEVDSIRPACAIVAGRARDSFSTNSLDRPGRPENANPSGIVIASSRLRSAASASCRR